MDTAPDYDRLYLIAESQAGYFTSAQARPAGFSYERLSSNASTGKFRRMSRGIYRLAYFPGSPFEDLVVALLQTGPHSVISHESALSVYELSDILPSEIHVTIPRTGSRRRKGIRLHTNRLESDEITTREGLRITTVARTIADVARTGIAEEQIQLAVQQALQRGLTTAAHLQEQVSRSGGRTAEIVKQAIEG